MKLKKKNTYKSPAAQKWHFGGILVTLITANFNWPSKVI